jgi:hypothetical protein
MEDWGNCAKICFDNQISFSTFMQRVRRGNSRLDTLSHLVSLRDRKRAKGAQIKTKKPTFFVKGVEFIHKVDACMHFDIARTMVRDISIKFDLSYVEALEYCIDEAAKQKEIANKRVVYKVKNDPMDFYLYRFPQMKSIAV